MTRCFTLKTISIMTYVALSETLKEFEVLQDLHIGPSSLLPVDEAEDETDKPRHLAEKLPASL